MGRQMGGRRAARPHRAPRTVAVATPNKGGASSKKPVQPPSALAEVASEVKVASTEVDALADYVKARGGRRVIRKVLIANNGMAATKSILSMRRWCYLQLGDDKAVEFVAMASPEDLKANAEYIRLADDFVEVPSGSNKNNYANVDLIVDIAEKEGCDAVWPGWGHASENPKLPATLKARGIQFIGPTAPVMSVLGDKIAANILAQTAKVPSIPWSGDGLTADLTEEGTIPDEIFQKAMVTTADEAVAAAERIGYPVMLKASEGGGGKGIRMSDDEEALRGNFEQVKAEVPGSPMFMMQLCSQARHLEVQIVGDEHGNAVALNGRDCSTQRRFQKIFEEGPPTVAPREIFREMEKAAQRLTQNIGYIGAGTVEYLFNAATGNFFFLELNPRLQVEHPVTEGLTGVNLPSIQLQVAMGIPLDRIPDVRRLYARDEDGDDKIDFMEDEYVLPERHVLAARITAENPDEGFKPTSGSIERISFQSTPNVWGYFSVGANGGVHEFADSQFGHLFASGPTREDARKALILALKDVNVYGEVRTAVDYLVELASTDAFRENTIDTSWLDGLIAKKSVQVSKDPVLIVMCAAMARAKAHTKEVEAQFAESWKRGQLAACNNAAGLQSMLRFPVEMTFRDVAYTVDVTRKSQDSYSLKIRGAASQDGIVCRARERSDGTLIITPMGAQRAFQVVGMEEPLGLRLVLDGQTFLLPNQNDPSELRTDVTGKLIRFLKKDGDEIQQGKPYAEVESMKMVMQLVASESGKITLKKPPGSVIEAGDLLAGLELEDPSKVKRATPFSGTFEPKGIMPSDGKSDGKIWQPDFSMMSMDGDMDEDKQVALDAAVEAMDLLLDGYEHDVESTVQQFITGLQEFVASQVELNGTEKWEMAMEYVGRVVSRYLAVEARFGNTSPEGAVAELVQAHAKDSPATITSAVLARSQVARRSDAIASLLRQLPSLPAQVMQSGPVSWQGDFAPISEDVKSDLERLSRLRRPEHGSVALAAANILLEKKLPSVDQRLEELRDLLAGKSAYKSSSGIEIAAGDLDALVGSPLLAVDLLPQLFGDDDTKVREAAITVFVKRMYRSHKVHGVEIGEVAGLPVAKFKFQYDTPPLESPMRFGMLAVASVMSDFEAKMPQLLERYQELQSDVKSDGESEHGPINVLHLACTDEKATLAADNESADNESAACADPSKVKRATPFSGTFEPKGIMPSDGKSDGKIWQPDFSMMSMDGDMDEDKQVALDAAVEAMDLLLDGYEHDVESTVQQFITGLQEFVASQVELNGTEKWEMAMEYVGRVVSRYLAVEARFGNTSPEGAVAELVQAHAKDSPATITSAVLARSQVARRSDAIASLLRQLPSLPAQVMQSGPVSWQGDFAPISEDVKSDLERLSRLRRPEHGSVALAAANILLEKKLPSVDQRLEELRDLLAGKSAYKSSSGIEIAAGDLDALVGSPLLAVDLLPQLFGDDDTKVREAAITVFVKRMYRSHKVHGVEIGEVAGLPVAKFKFQYDTPPLESPMRFGMLAVASVMSDFEAKMPQLLERYQELQSDVKSDGESEHGPINVLHLACTDEKATLAADNESADNESAACADPSKVKRATPFSGTFEPKGIMPSDGKSDGKIWQQDFSMMSMDGDMDEDKQVALDAAVEAMDLLLDGYEHDVESTVQQFITGLQEFVASQVELNGTEKWEMAMEYVGRVVSRYLAVEARFGNTSPEGAVAELVQAHAKDSPATITSAVLARSQVARRSDAIASLLRQLPSLPAQVMQSGPVSWQGDFAPISEDVKSDLERLSRLRRPEHGSVALAAANILLEKKLPSVDQRLEELRDLLAGKSAYKSSSGIEIAAGDLDALVGSPLLAVDLLPQLFGDDDTKVREAAITVFVKRMYRSHKVHGVEIGEVAGLPVAKFKFQYDTPPLESPMRFGMLAVASVMSDFEAKMPQLLERYQELQSDVKSDGESEHGPINVLHLACTDEKATLAADNESADNESAACAEAISASVKSMGEACGLKYVNVIAHESKQLPRYYTYTAAKEYAEDPLYRGCRPTLAHLLELSRLQNYELTRIPTFNRDLHIYSGAVTDGSRQMPQMPQLLQAHHALEGRYGRRPRAHHDQGARRPRPRGARPARQHVLEQSHLRQLHPRDRGSWRKCRGDRTRAEQPHRRLRVAERRSAAEAEG
ncbi:acetyl-CoA carboxylase [Pycnococcus provasolii]